MRIIRRTFANLGKSTLLLGHAGENLVTKLEIDISKERVEFTTPVFELVLKTPAISEPYPVLIDVLDDSIVYSFTGSDLQESGYGELEALVCGPNGEVLKSSTAKIRIEPSIITNSYPGPLQRVIDYILELAEELKSGGVKVVYDLPEDVEVNTIVYLFGSGLYVFTVDNEWVQLTDDEVVDRFPEVRDDVDFLKTESHTHDNLDELNRLFLSADGTLHAQINNGSETVSVSIIKYESLPVRPLISNEVSQFAYVNGDGLFLWRFDSDTSEYSWHRLTRESDMTVAHGHGNKSVIDKITEHDGKMLFAGKPVASDDSDDVALLTSKTYNELYLRDDFANIGSIDDVPVFVLAARTSYVGGSQRLIALSDERSGKSIHLREFVDSVTGLPVRMIMFDDKFRVSRNCYVNSVELSSGVWYVVGTDEETSAPSFSGFHPTVLELDLNHGYVYSDLSNLPLYALSALRSLSQCVNVSAEAMGTISETETRIQRFSGVLKEGMRYRYVPINNFTLDFPTHKLTALNPVIMLDLYCPSDISVTLPREKLLDGGILPNTTTGNHTLIFTYVPATNEGDGSIPAAGKWSVGCVNRVQPQYWDDIPDTVIPLEDCTWTQIKSIAEHGYLNRAGQWCIRRNNEEEVWFEIGDEKTVALSSGETWTMQIWDFNHDGLADGSGIAPFTFGMSGVTANTYRLNAYNTTAGGWEECYFRTQTLPTIIALLPQALQDALTYVTKSTSISQKNGSPSSRVFADTTDALFCPTLTEIGIDLGAYPGVEGGSKYSIFNTLSCATDSEYATRGVSFYAGTVSGFSKCSTSGTRAYLADASTPIKMRLAFCI